MRSYLEQTLRKVLDQLDGVPGDFEIEIEAPQNPEHGDLSTNAAMKLARYLRRAPREIAVDLVDRLNALPLDAAEVSAVEVAGAGFINFRASTDALRRGLAELLTTGKRFGRLEVGTGQTALVEFVSANPTGPLTVGHGRNAVLGDTIANLFEWAGYDVTREYYYNDAGRQMRVLGQSVRAWYLKEADPSLAMKTLANEDADDVEVPEPFPADGYQGDYIRDIARKLYDAHGEELTGAEDDVFAGPAEKAILGDIQATMGRLGIRMDSFFTEQSLYRSGKVWEVVDRLRDAGFVYEEDGAVWFKTRELGKEKDTVLIKSSGEPTYRLPDIAYHADKLERGYDRVIDVFGADHIATYPDVVAGVQLLGFDTDRIEVVIYQFVTITRGGEQVKMSTRRATYVTLDELMDEVGEDVVRYFFLMRSPNTHLPFDLDLAKDHEETNPVYYLLYAYARICSILRKASEVGLVREEEADLSLLRAPEEVTLTKQLLELPRVVEQALDALEPHRMINYLQEVARDFTAFYTHCRIIGQEPPLARARLALADAARTVLGNGLRILGIAPRERM